MSRDITILVDEENKEWLDDEPRNASEIVDDLITAHRVEEALAIKKMEIDADLYRKKLELAEETIESLREEH